MGAMNATSAQALHLVFFTHEALSVEPTFQVRRDQIYVWYMTLQISRSSIRGFALAEHCLRKSSELVNLGTPVTDCTTTTTTRVDIRNQRSAYPLVPEAVHIRRPKATGY